MPICGSYEDSSSQFLWVDDCCQDGKTPDDAVTTLSDISAEDETMDELVISLNRKLHLKSPSCLSICKQHRTSSVAPYSFNSSHKSSATMSKYRSSSSYSTAGSGGGDPMTSSARQRQQVKVPCREKICELLQEGSLIKEAVKRLRLKTRSFKDLSRHSSVDYDVCDIKSSNSSGTACTQL